ncbi:MAG: flagellar basal body L-ring protein FlgH [Oligoflexia bacterium]|nr:flagellar basal body L-ring protein FlgH [Oligoflexia bacterium]
MKQRVRLGIAVSMSSVIAGCMAPTRPDTSVPAEDYSRYLRQKYAEQQQRYPGATQRPGGFYSIASVVEAQKKDEVKARLRFAADGGASANEVVVEQDKIAPSATEPEFHVERSSMQNTRPYEGSLNYGDPGVTASLWQESRSGSELYRDDRAWQPMDLITIVVTERSEGKKEANTEVKEKSTVEAAIDNLLGYETDIKQGLQGRNNGVPDLSSLVKASSQNDFKGEGKTNRKGSLTARISAMVAEVLPSGILRIEGKKIISVNSEEQIMIITGLVRPRDINSDNEVDSSKIAQLRIDYYGEGTVGEAQDGGWLSRMMRKLWPF